MQMFAPLLKWGRCCTSTCSAALQTCCTGWHGANACRDCVRISIGIGITCTCFQCLACLYACTLSLAARWFLMLSPKLNVAKVTGKTCGLEAGVGFFTPLFFSRNCLSDKMTIHLDFIMFFAPLNLIEALLMKNFRQESWFIVTF